MKILKEVKARKSYMLSRRKTLPINLLSSKFLVKH